VIAELSIRLILAALFTAGASDAEIVRVVPERAVLTTPYDRVQILVFGKTKDGQPVDLTCRAVFSSDAPDVVSVTDHGRLVPVQNGTARVSVAMRGQEYVIPVTVRLEKHVPDFVTQVVPAISRAGCNSGACHGAPSGKRGFRLSLRGHDPALDYASLTRQLLGRRISVVRPDSSLVLRKPSGRTPHEGGVRLRPTQLEYRVLHDWIAAGVPKGTWDRTPTGLEVYPKRIALRDDRDSQQLRVVAQFSDGSSADVTHLAVFSVSDGEIAEVGPDGLVRARTKGETAVLVRYLDQITSVRVSFVRHDPQFVWGTPEEHNFIDRCVNEHLRELEIAPSPLCSDEVFLRRAYLDLLGRIPSPEEARRFLLDKSPQKRERLVDELLQRPEFVDFWAMKWLDVLGVNAKKLGMDAAARFHVWFRLQLARNVPLDRLARELLTATGDPVRNPAVYFSLAWREPADAAETVAQVFLGIRMQCARCHNHPFERWTQDDYYGLAAFFARTRIKKDGGREVVYVAEDGGLRHPSSGEPVAPRPLLGKPLDKLGADPRAALADWLVTSGRSMFAQAVANRVWYHLLGRGIVDPADDIRDSNPPAHDRLLKELGDHFANSGYDLRNLIKVIVLSATYQRSSVPNRWNKNDDRYFSRNVPRLLSAEQLLNAICAATGVPERFSGMPPGMLATQIPDPSVDHPFLRAFGQPNRDLPCECERSNDPSLTQVLELINGTLVTEKITSSQNCLSALLEREQDDGAIVTELYLRTLSRFPTQEEKEELVRYVRSQSDRRRAFEDILWSLLNSRQFLYRL